MERASQVVGICRLGWTAATGALIALAGLNGCNDEPGGSADASDGDMAVFDVVDENGPLDIGQQVDWPTLQWTLVDPAVMGMDATVLEEAREYAFQPEMNTQAVIVVRGGAIVAEWYEDGAGASSWAASWSTAKSVTSALIGIAIDEGLIEGVDVPLDTFFPEWEGTPRGDILLRSVLQMQSGLYYVPDTIGQADDALAYALELPVQADPDAVWFYSNSGTELLEGVLEAATEMTAAEYAQERLFDPLGMTPVEWWSDGAGHTLTFCCIDTPSRQLAKFGLLFLRQGDWDGQQLVSSEWVAESTTNLAVSGFYAYQWWKPVQPSALPADLYMARGADENNVYVIPSLDLVVVRQSIYRKPPGDAVAEGGFGQHLGLSGEGTYGTLAPWLWRDDAFLAPIINSIAGAEPVVPADCAAVDADCQADEGCQAIMQCAQETGCILLECYEPETCQEVIDDAGGLASPSAGLAVAVGNCL